jgi:hypothetical protein
MVAVLGTFLAVGSVAGPVSTAFGVANDDTWNGSVNDGLWGTGGNWTAIPGPFAPPNGIDDIARFYNSTLVLNVGLGTLQSHTANIAANTTLGSIYFDANAATSTGHTIGATAGSLILGVSSGNALIQSTINNGHAANAISAPIAINNNLDIDLAGLGGLSLVGVLTR